MCTWRPVGGDPMTQHALSAPRCPLTVPGVVSSSGTTCMDRTSTNSICMPVPVSGDVLCFMFFHVCISLHRNQTGNQYLKKLNGSLTQDENAL